MFDRLKIEEGMTIVGAHGQPVGVVERVAGDSMKLTGHDVPGDTHMPLEHVDRVENGTVYLKMLAGDAAEKTI